MAKNVAIKIGLVISLVLALYAYCLSVGAAAYMPDGTKVETFANGAHKTAIGTVLLRSGDWRAKLHFNDGDEGIVKEISGDNICGYGVSVLMPKVSAELQEVLDSKHLEIIEVNLVRFTDMEPWNKLEPDVQSIYFVVNPYETDGDVVIDWQAPDLSQSLGQGFRMKKPYRCCFTLSVNNMAAYLYEPGEGGTGIRREHIGFNDNVLLFDTHLMSMVENIVRSY
ncbi:hypothetical protein IKG54_01225 [Candidatus Saccharibacteria bacterium]|nr:hypothetical protein [Candidatus Saccharibacteria bacterium]